ncbi:MAG: aminopeptidase [Pseudomonadota bacterium]
MIKVTRDDIYSGNWINIAEEAWKRGQKELVQVDISHPQNDKSAQVAIESVISGVGTYNKGNNVFVALGPGGCDFAIQLCQYLEAKGLSTKMIIDMRQAPKECAILAMHIKNDADKELITNNYLNEVKWLANENQTGNWITIRNPNEHEPSSEENDLIVKHHELQNALHTYTTEMMSKKKIISAEVIAVPTENEAAKFGLGFDEFRNIYYEALSVSPEEIIATIKKLSFYPTVLTASREGKNIRVTDEHGTDLVINLKGRALIADVGKIGNISLDGTPAFESVVTNHYSGECFTAPVENTASGVICARIPLITTFGTIDNYDIAFENGKAVLETTFKDKKGETRHVKTHAKIGNNALLELTGLSEKGYTGNKLTAHRNCGNIAELGICPVNPVIAKKLSTIGKTTGNALIDEKLRLHIATGYNDYIGGQTPASVGGFKTSHTDFLLGLNYNIEFE